MSDNADLPAMPIEINGFGQYAPMAYTGLTKREHFIAMAMQGLCANPSVMQCDIINEAIATADNVIAEMDGIENGTN